jgi:hypothetical protein
MRVALKYVFLGGVLAGALDIAYAFGFYALQDVSPLRILQSIASGLLGTEAYRGGAGTAVLGAVLHFAIAIVAAAVFHAASRAWHWLIEHPLVAGIVFGLCVYGVMNFVVLPLSAFPHPRTFPPLTVITGLLAHMFLVGVPIALCARAAARHVPVRS